ncbi:MAG: helix-turn-helix domain-containing protein [Trichormus sp. ATA11-4-KO1]|nr:helix-turn-helix domain-containing protein [Trichormus sp. ATA11-4-KO1]
MSLWKNGEAIRYQPLHWFEELPMPKRYIVQLNQEERKNLQDLVSTGRAAAYKIKHANILLNIDINGQGWTDEEAAKAFSCHRNTIANLRERLVKVGLESALERQINSKFKIINSKLKTISRGLYPPLIVDH